MAITNEDAAKLSSQVYALVRACPPGRVTTYGALGKALGHPRGARMIGWIMNETPDRLSVPAQRVISKDGTLTGGWAFGGVEAMLSEIARFIVFDLGVRRLVVAGGETSGSVVRALGITDVEVGPYREPGFSRAVAAKPFPIALMLKSGKLGSLDIFASALDDMRRPISEEPLLTRWPPKS